MLFNLPWIVYTVIAAIMGSLVGFIDNYITDVLFDGKHAQAQKMIAGPMYAIVGVSILAITQPSFNDANIIMMLVGAGLVGGLSSVPYYAGMACEETTTSKIFAQLIPVFSLILAWIFLGQEINTRQFLAFGVMMLAPLVVVLSKDRRSKKTSKKAAFYFILNGFIYAVSSLLFVQGATKAEWGFWESLGIFMIGRSSMDMLLMATQRRWRRHFYHEAKKQGAKLFAVIIGSMVIWIFADMLYRSAMVDAEALALANMSYEAIEIIATFFLGVVLSLLWPKFGREKLTRREVMAHLIATVIAVIGIVLIG